MNVEFWLTVIVAFGVGGYWLYSRLSNMIKRPFAAMVVKVVDGDSLYLEGVKPQFAYGALMHLSAKKMAMTKPRNISIVLLIKNACAFKRWIRTIMDGLLPGAFCLTAKKLIA